MGYLRFILGYVVLALGAVPIIVSLIPLLPFRVARIRADLAISTKRRQRWRGTTLKH